MLTNPRNALREDPAPKTEPRSVAATMPRQPSGYLMTKKGYLHPMKTYLWLILLITGLMSALWFVEGIGPDAQGTIPPWFAFGASDLYFHSIAIGIGSIAALLVIMAFDLERFEPRIDFPIAYRATLGTIIGAIGGFLYLRPVFRTWLAPLPVAFVFVGLLFLADVGGALLIQLYLLPAKISGRYDSADNILGMVPRWSNLPKWGDLRRMDGTYWLTLVTVAGTFIAGVIGFVVFWLNYFVIDLNISPSALNGYIGWLGGAPAFMGAAMGAHSHVIGITLMVGVVAVTAKRFGVLNLTGAKRTAARAGLWISGVGVAIMTFVYLMEAFAAYIPPLLFASNPGGSIQLWSSTAPNGMAGDDTTMLLASAGAVVLLVPLMLTSIRGKPAWKDPLRMSILATWVLAFMATPLEGFFIEFHEATLSGGPTDVVFGNQQYFALFGLTMVTMAFLALDFFQDRKGSRSVVAALGMLVCTFTVAAGYIYAYFDPGALGPGGTIAGTTTWGWVYAAGLFLVSAVIIAAVVAVLKGADEPVTSFASSQTPQA
jgi:hypothetical protein